MKQVKFLLATGVDSRINEITVGELAETMLKDDPIIKRCSLPEIKKRIKEDTPDIIICCGTDFVEMDRDDKLALIKQINNTNCWFAADTNDSTKRKYLESIGVKHVLYDDPFDPEMAWKWIVSLSHILGAYVALQPDHRIKLAGFSPSNIV